MDVRHLIDVVVWSEKSLLLQRPLSRVGGRDGPIEVRRGDANVSLDFPSIQCVKLPESIILG